MTSAAKSLQLRHVFTGVLSIAAGNYFYIEVRMGLFRTDHAPERHLRRILCFRRCLNGCHLFAITEHMLSRGKTANSAVLRISELSTETGFNI
jgi:hypothetical protein